MNAELNSRSKAKLRSKAKGLDVHIPSSQMKQQLPSPMERLDILIRTPSRESPIKTPANSFEDYAKDDVLSTSSDSSDNDAVDGTITIKEESEIAAAKLKCLDVPKSKSKFAAAQTANRPRKDVNTFINNQLKFSPNPNAIPRDQMKCNDLKGGGQHTRPIKTSNKRGVPLKLDRQKSSELQCLTSEDDEDDDDDDAEHDGEDGEISKKNAATYNIHRSPRKLLGSMNSTASVSSVETSFVRGKPVTKRVSTISIQNASNNASAKVIVFEKTSSRSNTGDRESMSLQHGPVATTTTKPKCKRTPSYASANDPMELSPWHVTKVEASRKNSIASTSRGGYSLTTEL